MKSRLDLRKSILICLIALISILAAACGSTGEPASLSPEKGASEKNGEIMLLFTSDVHCGIDKGFGYAGLYEMREKLESDGYTTLLIDNGDSIQGELIGSLSEGADIIELMNSLNYDIAVPGNHEFDYTVERFLELAEMADFPYISCNFNKEGELIFEPYKIIEAEGKKIAFVGVTTPNSLTTSTPKYFQDEDGNFIYGFMQDGTGEALYSAVQAAVDSARAEGAELVYALGHTGNRLSDVPWSSIDIIEHTSGIDVYVDGHSHDTEFFTMKNKDGEDVLRASCGTKLNAVCRSRISEEGTIAETELLSWPNEKSMPETIGLENDAAQAVSAKLSEFNEMMKEKLARTDADLTIFDPKVKDANGRPLRMVRRAETNLGDLCADAILYASGADIAFVNGGGVRVSIEAGDISYGDIVSVFPFGNMICTVEMSGQNILDFLEWGAHSIPGEFGGFLQASGISYDIDVSVPSSCVMDESGFFVAVSGERRVKNVTVGGEPLEPDKLYTVAGTEYTLVNRGDGYPGGFRILNDSVKLDNQALIDYIEDKLGGTVGDEYADPYGNGRINIIGQN